KKELLLIGGSSGVGKSALISEIHKPIMAKKGLFIEGKFDQFQKNIPYYGFIQAFNDFVNLLLSENTTKINYWKDLILKSVGGLGKLLIDLVPQLKLIIGEQPEVNNLTGVEAQNRFNYVLQQFITTIAQEKQALVLFIDDWQWADQASLDLLKNIMLQTKGQNILVIAAYRNDEVSKKHPFSILIGEINEELKQTKTASIQSFLLQNLTLEQVNQLVRDTLKGKKDFVNSLANLVYEKTYGNAFFVRQFLISLYKEGLVYFNSELLQWEGNLDAIYQQNFTNNVVSLMLKKVKELPAQTIEQLQLAACIGSRFEIETLLTLSQGISKTSIEDDLLPAIKEGFLLPTSVYRYLNTQLGNRTRSKEIIYQFAHDHVQQAFYSLIEDTNKQHFHFQIGRLLLKKAKENTPELLKNNDALIKNIFEIVKHLNIGKHFVIDRSDKNELAHLNLLAGKKARASAAYKAADRYLQDAINLLGENAFENNYAMALELHETAIEAAYMNHNSNRYLELIAVVLSKAETVTDSIKVRNVQIQSHIKNNRLLEAVGLGEKILKELGLKFPNKPNKLQAMIGLVQTRIRLIRHSPASLLEHPQMKNERLLAAMEVLAPTATAAYWSKPDLMPLLIIRMVQLSIKYGNNSFSPFAYSAYGIVLCGILGKIEKGYKFGQLALKLIDKY
ncbi:MAG: ATP-binding protein, partial [Chitinophagales bacterium]